MSNNFFRQVKDIMQVIFVAILALLSGWLGFTTLSYINEKIIKIPEKLDFFAILIACVFWWWLLLKVVKTFTRLLD